MQSASNFSNKLSIDTRDFLRWGCKPDLEESEAKGRGERGEALHNGDRISLNHFGNFEYVESRRFLVRAQLLERNRLEQEGRRVEKKEEDRKGEEEAGKNEKEKQKRKNKEEEEEEEEDDDDDDDDEENRWRRMGKRFEAERVGWGREPNGLPEGAVEGDRRCRCGRMREGGYTMLDSGAPSTGAGG